MKLNNAAKVYPAVFHPEEDGYSVSFPDLPGCYTDGQDLADAMTMAEWQRKQTGFQSIAIK